MLERPTQKYMVDHLKFIALFCVPTHFQMVLAVWIDFVTPQF